MNKKTKYLFSIVLCCIAIALNAQSGVGIYGGARGNALGGIGLNTTDATSTYSNPGALANVQTTSVSIQGEQRFLLTDLSLLNVAGALPTKSGNFGLSIQHYGNDDYNEQKIGLSYGRKLVENFSLGLELSWVNVSAGEYGSKGIPTFAIGAQGEISSQLDIGAYIFNPLRQEITTEEPLATLMRIGLDYHPSKKVSILVEAEKDVDYDLRTHWGIEYMALEDFYLRLGIATQPSLFSFGFGYQMNNGLVFDLAAAYHQMLGFTPSIGITFNR